MFLHLSSASRFLIIAVQFRKNICQQSLLWMRQTRWRSWPLCLDLHMGFVQNELFFRTILWIYSLYIYQDAVCYSNIKLIDYHFQKRENSLESKYCYVVATQFKCNEERNSSVDYLVIIYFYDYWIAICVPY